MGRRQRRSALFLRCGPGEINQGAEIDLARLAFLFAAGAVFEKLEVSCFIDGRQKEPASAGSHDLGEFIKGIVD